MAPSSLCLTPEVESPWCRMDRAEKRQGGHRIYFCFSFRAFRCARRWAGGFPRLVLQCFPWGGKLARGARLMRGRSRGSGSRRPLIRPACGRSPSPRGRLFCDPSAEHSPQPPRQRVAVAQPLAALLPYGCGVLLAGKAERAGVEACHFRFPPRSTAQGRYAGTQLFAGAVRRRDDGAIDPRRTDSPDPRHHERAAQAGRPFVKAIFSSTGRGAFSF